MKILMDEETYAIEGPDGHGEPVPYGEIATLAMDEDNHYIALVTDPDATEAKLYECRTFPRFSEVSGPVEIEETAFGGPADGHEDGDDTGGDDADDDDGDDADADDEDGDGDEDGEDDDDGVIELDKVQKIA
jgi:hypothetical protein